MTLEAKTRPQPSVGAGLAKGLLDLAVARGAARERLLARSALTEAELADQDGRVPLAKYIALMHAGQDLARDPALALHFGEAINLADLSIFGNIGREKPTLAEGIEHMNRYGRLLIELDSSGGEAFIFARESGKTWLVDNRAIPAGFHELIESAFARITCWTRAFSAPGRPFVKAIAVRHKAPAYAAEYDRVLRVPVTFESARNALLIDASWTPRPEMRQSRYVNEVLTRRAEELLQSLDNAGTVRGRVEAHLVKSLRDGEASLACVARALGFSRKSLYRKLKDEGTSYGEVFDDLRRRTALHCLNGDGGSINETARLLGFSDASAFSRAFKRWTGKSPRDFKRQAPP